MKKETRGRKRKYDFHKMKVGDILCYQNTTSGSLKGCAMYYCKKSGRDWKFITWSEDGINIIRVK